MLKEKKELVSYLKARFGSLVFNQEKLNTVVTEIENCKKNNVNFWEMNKKGIRFIIEGSGIKSYATVFDATVCRIEEDDISISYVFFNNKGEYLFLISILKE